MELEVALIETRAGQLTAPDLRLYRTFNFSLCVFIY